MTYTAEQIQQMVERYIATMPYDRKPFSLYEPIKYVLSIGGKRLRPTLTLLGYNLWKDDLETVLPTACAIEMYHNYTLLHDDFMDNADLRRGHPTVHKRWNANTAILSGDTMLVLAYKQMIDCVSRERLAEVLKLFSVTALEVGEGQQYDMDFEHRYDVTEAEYIEMIRLKTSVLLACAVKVGAIMAGSSSQDADTLYAFGEKMGLAFQLQDDYLDVYGDTKTFGKAIGGDILANKKTYMLINAINNANPEQRNELMKWLECEDAKPQDKIQAVTELYTEIGVDKLALDRIRTYYAQAGTYLDKVSVSEERKTELREYAAQMLKRVY